MNYENFVCAVEGLAKKFHATNPDMYIHINRTDNGLEVSCIPIQDRRDQWVEQMLREYYEAYSDESEIILCDPEHKVMVVKFEDLWRDPCYGIAKCSPNDEFDADIGMAVAFAHFRGYAIPDFV